MVFGVVSPVVDMFMLESIDRSNFFEDGPGGFSVGTMSGAIGAVCGEVKTLVSLGFAFSPLGMHIRMLGSQC